jgi:hydroxymethylbilane synthase
MVQKLTIGTRRSKLALRQSFLVREALVRAFPTLQVEFKEIITQGDKNLEASLASIGGKGIFTAELEEELLQWNIDIAVHSLKDLPTEDDPRFVLGAILPREYWRDVLVTRDKRPFAKVPSGSVIGTSSPRREAQLRRLRPDLTYKDIRGNVDTRLRKVSLGDYYGIVLAEAGLARIGLLGEIAQRFSAEELLPAPGQGALAIQCASDRSDVITLLASVDSLSTRLEVTAERTFLKTLDAGCTAPLGALAIHQANTLTLRTRCLSHDGGRCLDLTGQCATTDDPLAQACELGMKLAADAVAKGFHDLT